MRKICIATGMHLSPELGLTYRQIGKDSIQRPDPCLLGWLLKKLGIRLLRLQDFWESAVWVFIKQSQEGLN